MKIKQSIFCLTLLFTFILKGNSQTSVTVGEKAPEINITQWIENVPDDKSLEGKSIVLEFWATWCAGCIEAVPHLNELKAQFDPKDIMFLSITDESQEKIERAIKRIHFETSVVGDDSEITHMGYGENGKKLGAIPKTILIDKEGIVQWIGHPTELNKIMLDKLISGKSIPAKEKFARKTVELIDDGSEESLSVKEEKNSVVGTTSKNLDFREATEDYQLQRKMNGVITFTDISLQDIYMKLFQQGQNQITVPVELQDKKYSFDYTYRVDLGHLEILEQEILSALNLTKREVTTLDEGVTLKISDKSKLEKALETRFSRISDAGGKLLLNGVSLKDFEDAINARMDNNYRINATGQEKYDFILNVTVQAALLASLESYGITSEMATIEVKKIKLTFKE